MHTSEDEKCGAHCTCSKYSMTDSYTQGLHRIRNGHPDRVKTRHSCTFCTCSECTCIGPPKAHIIYFSHGESTLFQPARDSL